MAWGLFGAVYVSLYALIVAIPVGLTWSVTARILIRSAPRSDAVDVSSSGWSTVGRSCLVLVAIAFAGGAFQAATTTPAGARCLDLGAGDVTDAAFSPAGDLLAATVQTDPNEPGVVLLLRWPSAEVLGRWEEWVDRDVAVGPDGRVYWSAWVLSGVATPDAPGDGVFVAAVGSDPTWYATGFETPLSDLTWTEGALRGTTPNSHALARIPLNGAVPSLVTDDDEMIVGTFWTSSDGTWTAAGPGWFGEDVQVSRAGQPWRTVDVETDPRSIALSQDRSTLVVASWFGGTRLVDVASGASRPVLRGSQRFVALSQEGDLAWASEEEFGQSRLCTTTLARLEPGMGE